MKAKKIKLLPDVTLPEIMLGDGERRVLLKGGLTYSMKQYLNIKVSNYPPFGGGKGNEDKPFQGMRIRKAFNESNGSFKLTEEDWKVLKTCVTEVGLTPDLAMHGIQFGEAVKNAEDVELIEKKGKKDG